MLDSQPLPPLLCWTASPSHPYHAGQPAPPTLTMLDSQPLPPLPCWTASHPRQPAPEQPAPLTLLAANNHLTHPSRYHSSLPDYDLVRYYSKKWRIHSPTKRETLARIRGGSYLQSCTPGADSVEEGVKGRALPSLGGGGGGGGGGGAVWTSRTHTL